ncbi:hypothetical protein Gasu2_04860 [Galdieria sulphuraria]|nr:hypothetical protein Gasu2_04860 [Galdieria sulphuraria]
MQGGSDVCPAVTEYPNTPKKLAYCYNTRNTSKNCGNPLERLPTINLETRLVQLNTPVVLVFFRVLENIRQESDAVPISSRPSTFIPL